ncbi:preprotein translocase subunit Sec61beta [Candidatus Pacearchaeota archaeon]|nr:preprotein translocase subunit Sec61beta [Candidatus Pacearchaeota archaeon]
MADNKVNLPGGFGGLTRFNEEYTSKINLNPSHVVVFILLIIGVRIILPFIF